MSAVLDKNDLWRRVEGQKQDIEALQRLCKKLLDDLKLRTPNRADSSLPEWEQEAKRLGVPV